MFKVNFRIAQANVLCGPPDSHVIGAVTPSQSLFCQSASGRVSVLLFGACDANNRYVITLRHYDAILSQVHFPIDKLV